MICRLCRRDRNLVKAHIIPKWAYMYLYPVEESRRQPLLLIGAGNKPNKNSPIGIYDSEILCDGCDRFLGGYDDYGKKILLQRLIEKYHGSDMAYVIKEVDVKKLEVFLLSVLWRASISKREEFKSVGLGPYEEEIWDILDKARSNKNIGPVLEDFSILISKFGDGLYPDMADRNIQMPTYVRIDQVYFDIIYFPRGFKIYIKLDKRPMPETLVNFQLQGNEIIIPKLKDFHESHEFEIMLRALTKKKTS